MTTNTESIAAVSDALLQARRTQQPVPAPSAQLADAAAAYAVQGAVAAKLGWFDDGPPRHWKSGGASRDAVLTHAPLPPAGVWSSPADARDWPFQLRGVEAEVALRLGREVDAATAASFDPEQAGEWVDAMCVTIEIVDSRWVEGPKAPPLARLADLQSHGALVLGEWVPFERRDWSAQVCRVRMGDRPPAEFRGSHTLGDPLYGLPAWLRHVTADGSVPAGTVVTTGTWIGLLDAAAGDRVTVEFPGIGQASIQL